MRVPLLHGWVPVLVSIAGLLALGGLLIDVRRPWWWRRLPIAIGVAAVATVGLTLFSNKIWQPFPDALPLEVVLLLGATVLAVSAAAFRWTLVRPRWRALLPAAAVVVLVSCLSAVNLAFGQYPTLRSLVGGPLDAEVAFGPANQPSELVEPPPGHPVAEVWQRPADLPDHGAVATVTIPGTTSGFHPRSAVVYLPPAYLTRPRARLPVLVMVTGQPGSPRDWFTGGQLAVRLDAFAAAHDGLAPVVVVPDVLGGPLANPLCLDSPLGNAASYLDSDVPAWVDATLHADRDRHRWAIGGYSSGGTCALQAGIRSPRTYPTVVDISGQDEITLGSRADTARAAFGGDQAALTAAEPLAQLGRCRLEGSAAMVFVGDHDSVYRPQQERVTDALRAAGADAELVTLHGRHSWAVWGPAVDRALPWLATRQGLS